MEGKRMDERMKKKWMKEEIEDGIEEVEDEIEEIEDGRKK